MRKQIVVGTLGIIWDEKDKYLLTKRHDPRNPYGHNKWQLPGGGLQFGETLVESLRREVMEELGVEVNILKQLPQISEFMRSNWHGIFICFLCAIKNPSQKIILNHEAKKFGWFTIDKIQLLDTLEGIKKTLATLDL